MNSYSFKYLVLSGGGVNGGLLIGALKFLKMYGVINNNAPHLLFSKLEGYAGASIGALLALFCILGISTTQMLQHFKTCEILFWKQRIFTNKALISHEIMENLISTELIRAVSNANITFKQLFNCTNKDFVVCCMNVNKVQVKFFRKDDTPDVRIIDAVIASMSLPLIFPPVNINGDLYIDGGVGMNFPVTAFNEPQATLGLCLRTHPLQASTDTLQNSMSSYIMQVMRCIVFAQDEILHSHSSILNNMTIIMLPMVLLAVPSHEVDFDHLVFLGSLHTYLQLRQKYNHDLTDASFFFMNLYFKNAFVKIK